MEGDGHRVEEAGSGDGSCEEERSAEGSNGEGRRERGLELREPSRSKMAETSAQKEKRREDEEEGACSDKELDELLDFSLGEFGKHIPPSEDPQPKPDQPDQSDQSSVRPNASTTSMASSMGDSGPPLPNLQDFEEIFSEEFAAQAQTQLGEAMQLLKEEDPQLWQQLQGLASAAPQPPGGGEGGGGGGSEGGEGEDGDSLEAKLEETLKKLKESTEQIESSGRGEGGAVPGHLSQLLGQLDVGAEDGEDQLMKVMEGMMDTLLSRDILYPSLLEICKQYPDWLATHRDKLSSEDFTRYSKQLEIMRAICQEFEKEEAEEDRGGGAGPGRGGRRGGGGGEGGDRSSHFDRILHLMQQLQQYGQPPPDIAGDALQQTGFPGFPPPFPGGPPGTPPAGDCCVM